MRKNWVSVGVATTAIVISTLTIRTLLVTSDSTRTLPTTTPPKSRQHEDETSSIFDAFKKNKDYTFNGLFSTISTRSSGTSTKGGTSEQHLGHNDNNDNNNDNDNNNNNDNNDNRKKDNSNTKPKEGNSSDGSSSLLKEISKMILPRTASITDSSHTFPGKEAKDEGPTIGSLANSFASLITGEISESDFSDMIHYAQNITQTGDISETRSSIELVNLFFEKQEEVTTHILNTIGSLDATGFDPTSMFYYLEHEDERKNPSWKRRKHRYFKGVDVSVVKGLNDALHLAEISYLDSIDEIRSQLIDKTKDEWELVYAQLDSYPEQPSHYLAIKKGQSRWSSQLEVLMVVRGTKTVPDILTDALLDNEDYQDGKAHAGILRSGKNLVDKHKDLMQNLLDVSKKKRIKLSLVGHSLGAGAAAIAGMEFKRDDKFDVEVIGFGCPAIISKELSESTKDYITTVIGDADVVPRMSAATIGNLMLNLMDYDWTPKAKRDIEDALLEVQKNVGFLIRTDDVDYVMNIVDKAVDKYVMPGMMKRGNSMNQRLDTILYPPGSCVHFYRDGVSISASYVNCDFFNEIDVARTMIDDHLISSGYRRIFLELERSSRGDDHFSFEDVPE
eukprot:scaffold2946_cov278-Chaetoceros_neogracile.AAC.16